jgi:hypothetical protein
VRARKDGITIEAVLRLAANGIDLANGLDGVAEELDADGGVGLVGREDLDDVATHAERTAVKIDVVSLVLDVDQHAEQVVATKLLADLEVDEQTGVTLGGADAVDAAHARDDDHVAAREQRTRRRVAHAIDLVVDDRVLVDVRVARRDVGLGLVVVVVADEVLDRVLREQLLHLAVELRGERLVRRHDERRLAVLRDHVADGERLAGARDAEEHLVLLALFEAAHELRDGLRLIALRLELRDQLEERLGHGERGIMRVRQATWQGERAAWSVNGLSVLKGLIAFAPA